MDTNPLPLPPPHPTTPTPPPPPVLLSQLTINYSANPPQTKFMSVIFYCRCREIQANLTATAVKNIPDSLRELAQQNRVMKRELLLHQDSIYETKQEIEQIREDIRFKVEHFLNNLTTSNVVQLNVMSRVTMVTCLQFFNLH